MQQTDRDRPVTAWFAARATRLPDSLTVRPGADTRRSLTDLEVEALADDLGLEASMSPTGFWGWHRGCFHGPHEWCTRPQALRSGLRALEASKRRYPCDRFAAAHWLVSACLANRLTEAGELVQHLGRQVYLWGCLEADLDPDNSPVLRQAYAQMALGLEAAA